MFTEGLSNADFRQTHGGVIHGTKRFMERVGIGAAGIDELLNRRDVPLKLLDIIVFEYISDHFNLSPDVADVDLGIYPQIDQLVRSHVFPSILD